MEVVFPLSRHILLLDSVNVIRSPDVSVISSYPGRIRYIRVGPAQPIE